MQGVHLFRAHLVSLPEVPHRDQRSLVGPPIVWRSLTPGLTNNLCVCFRCDSGFAHQLPPLAFELPPAARCWRLTVIPSFKVFSTRLGPLTTSMPDCRP